MRVFAGLAGLLLVTVTTSVAVSEATNGLPGCPDRVMPSERLPISGANFESYCMPCILALRTFGRTEAVAATVEAYQTLEEIRPETRYMYGEVGYPWGGPFPPHRTHREGLSFDFMVPLTDGDVLPAHAMNRYGYDAEFDETGRDASGRRIDFGAIGDHLIALEQAAQTQGGRVRRVILAPDLQDDLEAASPGILNTITFNTRQAWVRHDDHYHVDFDFPCP